MANPLLTWSILTQKKTIDCFFNEQVRLVEPPSFSVHTVRRVAVMLYLQQTQWLKKGTDLGKSTDGSASIVGESDVTYTVNYAWQSWNLVGF